MAFWNDPGYTFNDINIGIAPNDGTGDTIRNSFDKIDKNFANLSTFLTSTTVTYLNSAVSQQFTSTGYTSITNLFVSNATGTSGSFTGNITVGNLTTNTGMYSTGITILTGNTYTTNVTVNGTLTLNSNAKISAHIIPTANLTYDLGSPNNFFRNIYSQGVVNVNTVTASSDAGILQLHASLLPGDTKDVGILGKFYKNSANNYAYFGYQYTSDNFVYKITGTDVTQGNSIVYNGVYGNTQFGSQFLSNTTISNSTATGALIVAGGVGVAGNVNAPQFYGNISATVANVSRMSVSGTVSGSLSVDGSIYQGGARVLDTSQISTLGYPTYTGGLLFVGNSVFASGGVSTTANTGAVVIIGGLGVGSGVAGGNINVNGNIYGTHVGPYYGTIQTASQPNITGLGTLGGLQVSGAVNASSLVITGGPSNFTQSTGTAIAVTANITAGGFVGSMWGTLQTAAQPNITSVGTLSSLGVGAVTSSGTIIAASVNAGTIGNSGAVLYGTLNSSSAAQTNITSVGTLSSLSVGGAITPNANASINLGGSGAYWNNFYSVTAAHNSVTIGAQGLTVTGSSTFSSATNHTAGIIASTVQAGTIGNTGATLTGTLSTVSQPNVTTLAGVTSIGASSSTTVTGTLQTAAQTNITSVGTLSSLSVGGAITPNANASINLGGSGSYWNNFYSATGTHNSLTVGAQGITTAGSTTIAGTFKRSAAGIGYLDGQYNSVETANTTGPIYSIGGSYFPTSTSLNTMYGIGYTFTGSVAGGNFGIGTSSGAVANHWGMYVASAGTARIFLDADNGTMYGTAVKSLYADLAENYIADQVYEPGTVVIFGGEAEITVTDEVGDERVAGVISTDPAYLMNSKSEGLPVALRGKVPVKVVGPVTKGDSLVTHSTPGYAVSVGRDRTYGQAVIAKSLETNTDPGEKVIIAVIL